MKPGSTFVLGETDPDLADVFAADARPRRRGAATSTSTCTVEPARGRRPRCSTCARPAARYDDVFLPLHGAHQGDNAAIALAAAEAFFDRPLDARRRGRGVRRRCARPGASRSSAATRSSSSTARTTPTAPTRRPTRSTRASRSSGERRLVVGVLDGRDPRELLERCSTRPTPPRSCAARPTRPARCRAEELAAVVARARRHAARRARRRRGRLDARSTHAGARRRRARHRLALHRRARPATAGPFDPGPDRHLGSRAMNRTFVMCKPDAVERGLVGEIVAPPRAQGAHASSPPSCARSTRRWPRSTTPSTPTSRSTASS